MTGRAGGEGGRLFFPPELSFHAKNKKAIKDRKSATNLNSPILLVVVVLLIYKLQLSFYFVSAPCYAQTSIYK